MNQSFVDKYKPESPDDIYGHPSAIKKIKRWANNWSQGDDVLLLHGPAGTGKTSTAETISNYADWGYVEINASSRRSKENIQKLAQQIRSQSEKPRLFVLDEIDSVNGRALQSLYSVLEDSPNPVICTANESWKVPDGLENLCEKHKFNLSQDSIKKYLKDIVEEEGIEISNREIGQLATRNGIRDALNDLQEFAGSEGTTDWDNRDTEDSPFTVARRVILNKDYIGDMTPDDMVAFLNENVKNEFDGVEAMRAYQALAESDKWLGQVNRTQDYSWWRYAGSISEEVANLRITEPYNDWVNINYPVSRRNYTPKATSDTGEAMLYRELKGGEGFQGAFNFNEFRKVILPIIKGLSKEERKALALSHSLSTKSMRAMGISKKEFDDWEMTEVEKQKNSGENKTLGDFVGDTENNSDEERKGLFDY